MLKVREYRKISGSLEPHSPLLEGKTTASGVSQKATLFLNKTKSDSGVIPRSAFTGGHLPGEHFVGRRGAVLPSPSTASRQTRTLVSCSICQTAGEARRREGRGEGSCYVWDGKPFPLARSLCVVQQKSGRITYFQQLTAAELSSSAAAAACTSTLEAENHSQFTAAAATAAIKAIKRGDAREGESGQPFLALLEHSPLSAFQI